MKRSEEITTLAYEILVDISDRRTPLHVSLLKASRLSQLLDMPTNLTLFQAWAEDAETMEFVVGSFNSAIGAAQDPSNFLERNNIRTTTESKVRILATYKARAYNFVMGIYTRWQFGNIAESIFERKRKRIEPVLPEILIDVQSRLNSVEQNLLSENSEDWKNAVASCRALLMDLADKLMPPKDGEDKGKYISRLQTYISSLSSETKKSLLETILDEIKLRIQYTMNLTQGGAHQDRPQKEGAEDVVLYTYLLLGEIAAIFESRKSKNQEALLTSKETNSQLRESETLDKTMKGELAS